MGDGAPDQRAILGDHRGARYSRTGGASRGRHSAGAWRMTSPIEHGDPVNGDLVDPEPDTPVPSDVADAVRTLIRWAGDDPDREGLLDTPRRVARAWKEYAKG